MTEKPNKELWESMDEFWKEYVESNALMQFELTEILLEKALKDTYKGISWVKQYSITTIVNSNFQNLIAFMEAKKK